MDAARGAATYLDQVAASGRYTFTTEEAASALGVSVVAVRASLRRLKARRAIADPHRGFHVIVPPEYRRLGCLPAEQFIPQLMEHLGEPYYVALLSAAELHGSAHQRPQSLQVMVRRPRRAIRCGAVRVDFVGRRDLQRTPVVETTTPRGPLRVSSPEATALELVGYADRAGGMGNVLSVLVDLAEFLDGQRLGRAARLAPIAWAQRLGYLLERAGATDLADALLPVVKERARVVAPLVRSRTRAGAERVARWKLAVNATIEADG